MMIGSKDYTVSRFAAGGLVRGDFVPGAETTLIINGSLQPLSAREIQQLQEGERARARWSFFTRSPLQMSDDAEGLVSDELHHKNRRLVVVGVDDFSDSPFLAHYEYLLAEKEV